MLIGVGSNFISIGSNATCRLFRSKDDEDDDVSTVSVVVGAVVAPDVVVDDGSSAVAEAIGPTTAVVIANKAKAARAILVEECLLLIVVAAVVQVAVVVDFVSGREGGRHDRPTGGIYCLVRSSSFRSQDHAVLLFSSSSLSATTTSCVLRSFRWLT